VINFSKTPCCSNKPINDKPTQFVSSSSLSGYEIVERSFQQRVENFKDFKLFKFEIFKNHKITRSFFKTIKFKKITTVHP
jgi:hypothetical protein